MTTKAVADTLRFLRCDDPKSTCEIELTLGRAGVCNVGTGLCECPDGFSGKDDWVLSNDCSVNEGVQFAVWVTSLVFSSLTCIIGFFAMVYLVDHWSLKDLFLFGDRSTEDGRTTSVMRSHKSQGRLAPQTEVFSSGYFSEEDDEENGADSPRLQRVQMGTMKRRKRRIKVHQRYMFVSLYLFTSYSFGNVLYFASYIAGKYRFDRFWVQDVGLTIAMCSMFAGLWAFFNLFRLQLPNLNLYGKLFDDINSILLRRPQLIRFTIRLRFVFIYTVVPSLLFYVGQFDISQDTRNNLDTAALYILTLLLIDFVAVSTVLLVALRRLYSKLLKLSNEAARIGVTSGQESKTFRKAINTVTGIMVTILLAAPVAAAASISALTIPAVRGRVHLSINFVLALGNVAVLIITFVSTRRLAGARVPRASDVTGSNGPASFDLSTVPSRGPSPI